MKIILIIIFLNFYFLASADILINGLFLNSENKLIYFSKKYLESANYKEKIEVSKYINNSDLDKSIIVKEDKAIYIEKYERLEDFDNDLNWVFIENYINFDTEIYDYENKKYIKLEELKKEEIADYYVSINGNDLNDGKSVDKAFKSIKNALEKVKSGEKIIVTEGTYTEKLDIEMCNYQENVTIKAKNGDEVIIEGNNSDYGFNIVQSKNIIIENFIIRNNYSYGINVLFSENIELNNNVVYNNGYNSKESSLEGYGINAKYSDNIKISGNNVYENGPSTEIISKGVLGTGINTFLLRRSLIQNNITNNNRGGGILVEDGEDVTVLNNVSTNNNSKAPLPYMPENNWWCGGIWIDGGKNVQIIGNRFENNVAGVYISDLDGQKGDGYFLKDNIIVENEYGIQYGGVGTLPLNEKILLKENNDISKNTKYDEYSDNIYYFEEYENQTMLYLNSDKMNMNISKQGIYNLNYAFYYIGNKVYFENNVDYIYIMQLCNFDDKKNITLKNELLFFRIYYSGEYYEFYLENALNNDTLKIDYDIQEGKLKNIKYTFNKDVNVKKYGYYYDDAILVQNKSEISITF